jgi:hypothetical protein
LTDSTKNTCPHTHIEREYLLGMHTGDTRCTQCGETWAPGETVER